MNDRPTTKPIHDRIFAIGSIILSIALLPALVNHIHAPTWSAGLTAGILAIFAANYGSMRMSLACATVALQAVLWTIVTIQSIH